MGGFIFFTFLVVLFAFIIVNVGSFLRRENKSVIYYSLKLAQTDQISFSNYSSVMAYQLKCDETNSTEFEDLIILDTKHISRYPDGSGKKPKHPTPLNHRPCTKADFYNEFDTSFDLMGVDKYECIDMTNTLMKGQFTDDYFDYYDFRLYANLTEFKDKKKGETVAFVGDGINDAPSLKLASSSFAMGAMGSDIAVDTADMAILNSDIENSLTEYGEPLRWAVVKATEDKFIIDAVFLEN